MLTVKGRFEAARKRYEQAATAGGGDLPPALAWRIGRCHWDQGQYREALTAYRRGRLDGSDPLHETLLLAWTTIVIWSQIGAEGAAATAEGAAATAELALAQARVAGTDRALAAGHYAVALAALGHDDVVAESNARLALDYAERAGDALHTVRIRILLAGLMSSFDSIEIADSAVRTAEIAGADLYLAAALLCRGTTRLHVGQLDAALADFKSALAIWERHDSTRTGWALMNLGAALVERGDVALARTTYERAVAVVERRPDPQGVMAAYGGLARVIATDDPDRAVALADRAEEAGRALGFNVSAGLLHRGWVAHAHGDLERSRRLGEEAAERSLPRHPWVPDALALQAVSSDDAASRSALLDEAIQRWRELGNPVEVAKAEYARARLGAPTSELAAARAKRKLRALGVRESAALVAGLMLALGPERRPDLEVQTLGSFRVRRRGDAVPADEWQSKKARDVLKLLVARRGRDVPREALVEALWPDDDPALTANRLSVALSTLRRVLDPERAHPPEHFVRSAGEAITLEPGRIVVDCEAFEAEGQAGLAAAETGRREEAVELLEAAEAAYSGDFLEEDVYEDWAVAPREELRSTYVAVGLALARLSDDPRAAAHYLRRIVERDPYDEATHLGLVSALQSARPHGEARRAYSIYVGRMEEIGVEPAPLTPP